ncbi:MAG: TolC family protein [Spirochaetales bacterium]|nr:TolC family protein [Spirochaetales bacterium]
MKSKKSMKILFIFILCLLIYPLYGIPLHQLPGLIQTRSKELEAMRMDIAVQQLDIGNQPFTYFPDLSLSYKGNFNRPFYDDFSHSHTFSLSSSLNLSDEQVFSDRIEILEYEKLLIEYDQYYEKLLYETIGLYIDALKKKMVYELARTNESVSTLNYEFAQSKNRLGTLSDIELLNAEADYDNSLYLSRKGKLDYDLALSSLRRKLDSPDLTIEDIAIGNPAYISIEEMTGKEPDQPAAPEEQANGAPSSPYTILIQEKQLKILKLKNIHAIRNRWLPRFDLGFSLTYDQYDYNSMTEEWTEMDPKINPSVTLSASIPLFARNEKRLAEKKSSIAIKKAEFDMEELQNQFEEEARELVELHNRSIDLLKITGKRVESARKEYDKKSESFKLGITTVIELYDTRDRYMEKEKEALEFSLDIILLRARIGNTVGNTFLFLGDDVL